jgi:hypothetical protein
MVLLVRARRRGRELTPRDGCTRIPDYGRATARRSRGFPRRRTATSCRKTSSSASLEALERARSTSQPTIRAKIRQSSRSDTSHDHPRPALRPYPCRSPASTDFWHPTRCHRLARPPGDDEALRKPRKLWPSLQRSPGTLPAWNAGRGSMRSFTMPHGALPFPAQSTLARLLPDLFDLRFVQGQGDARSPCSERATNGRRIGVCRGLSRTLKVNRHRARNQAVTRSFAWSLGVGGGGGGVESPTFRFSGCR